MIQERSQLANSPIHKIFVFCSRFLDLLYNYFLNQTMFDLRKTNWGFLNGDLSALQLLRTHMSKVFTFFFFIMKSVCIQFVAGQNWILEATWPLNWFDWIDSIDLIFSWCFFILVVVCWSLFFFLSWSFILILLYSTYRISSYSFLPWIISSLE